MIQCTGVQTAHSAAKNMMNTRGKTFADTLLGYQADTSQMHVTLRCGWTLCRTLWAKLITLVVDEVIAKAINPIGTPR